MSDSIMARPSDDAGAQKQGNDMTPDEKILATMTGIDKALHLAGVEGADRFPPIGAVEELATRLRVTRQAVHFFKKQGWLPADRAREVHTLYGIPLRELAKPDTK